MKRKSVISISINMYPLKKQDQDILANSGLFHIINTILELESYNNYNSNNNKILLKSTTRTNCSNNYA